MFPWKILPNSKERNNTNSIKYLLENRSKGMVFNLWVQHCPDITRPPQKKTPSKYYYINKIKHFSVIVGFSFKFFLDFVTIIDINNTYKHIHMTSTYTQDNCHLLSLNKGPPNANSLFALKSFKHVETAVMGPQN